jgi:SAM-dependent methyltransferase
MSYSQELKSIWQKDSYYDVAMMGSSDFSHPAWEYLVNNASRYSKVADFGCGEGTRIGTIKSLYEHLDCTGIDISKKAIDLAKNKYKKCRFLKRNIEELNLKEKFDLIFSFFVIEHVDNPEKFIQSAITHLAQNGCLIIAAPNYGAPNRRSPNSKEPKLKKLVSGFFTDFSSSRPSTQLNWTRVEPQILPVDSHVFDSDTTVEPYILTLRRYLGKNNISHASSIWERDNPRSLTAMVFNLLGRMGIYPFKYWGPHLIVVFNKR